MIAILGDIHFRDDKDYFCQVSEEFLNWFGDWDKNNSNNSLILAGDLVETSLMSGKVVDYLERLISSSRFKSIDICCGNHDKKKYHNENQLSYEFFKSKPNVHVWEKIGVTTIDGLKVLMLPYYLGLNEKNKTMSEYYSNLYTDKKFNQCYDLVIGHFCGEDASYPGSSDLVLNLDKLNSKNIILGHIHTRFINPNRYIGSVFAGKKNENDNKRSAILIDSEGNKTEERLPIFNEFISVLYPEELPPTKAIVPIYTICNCSSESAARSKYGNIYIKNVTSDKVDTSSRTSIDMDRQFQSIKNMNIKDLFNAYAKSQEVPLDAQILTDCLSLLGTIKSN